MEQIKDEIIQRLLEAAQTEKPSKFKDLKKYIGTRYDLTGLSAPTQKALFKSGFSFSRFPAEGQLSIWAYLWKESCHFEIMNLAQMFVSKNLPAFDAPVIWDITKNWVSEVDNWAHSYGLSSIYSRLLEKQPEIVYKQYELWNASGNPWERRQSLVGLCYYSSVKRKTIPFEKLKAMVNPLLNDGDYFVQKGLGWTLREMGNIYPAETLSYLTQHINLIRPVAFTAAIEKLDVIKKDRLKQLRKDHKKKAGK
jgi:3-methyladenine DNA glycosylase AlkD